MLPDVAATYHRMIEWIMSATALPDSTLHVHVGLLIFFGVALLLRGKLASPWPLAVVTAAELFNECMDAAFFGSWRWDDTGRDIFHSLLWPVLVSLGAWIFSARASARRADETMAIAAE
jgi:hypothetical protein